MTSRRAGDAVFTASARYRFREAGVYITRSAHTCVGGQGCDLPGEPVRLVLQLAQRDFHGAELFLQARLLRGQPGVPVADRLVEAVDLVLVPLDSAGDR